MSRYDKTYTKRNEEGNIVRSTIVYKDIPITNDDMYVLTQHGDRLDLLAHQFYGDANLWWYIAKANNLKTNTVDIGTTLRIPGSIEFAEGED